MKDREKRDGGRERGRVGRRVGCGKEGHGSSILR